MVIPDVDFDNHRKIWACKIIDNICDALVSRERLRMFQPKIIGSPILKITSITFQDCRI